MRERGKIPLASPRDGNSVARERAREKFAGERKRRRRRKRKGNRRGEGEEKLFSHSPLLATEIPSRERERGREKREREREREREIKRERDSFLSFYVFLNVLDKCILNAFL